MNIALTQHTTAPGTTLTFDIETAVHTLWGDEGDGIKKLRALATLLDIEIPKGLRTIREENDTVNAKQMKAAYIADLIEKRVRVLEDSEREDRYAYANNI